MSDVATLFWLSFFVLIWVFWQFIKFQSDGKPSRNSAKGAGAGASPSTAKSPPVLNAWTARQIVQLDKMSGVEFENYVAGMARSLGLHVEATAATGDYGVDLVIQHVFAVQCKRQGRPVGVSAVQQVIAGAVMHECSPSSTFVVSNQTFTPAARNLAARTGCGLYGRENLHQFRDLLERVAEGQDRLSGESSPEEIPPGSATNDMNPEMLRIKQIAEWKVKRERELAAGSPRQPDDSARLKAAAKVIAEARRSGLW